MAAVLAGLQTAVIVNAQSYGNCAPSKAEAYLDVNEVRARIPNDGRLFWRGEPHVYNVPKSSDSNAIFSGNIWIGGLIDDEVHVAATLYTPAEFWAGPLNDTGAPPDDCSEYDRIYKITQDDIDAYETSGVAVGVIRDWPTGLGAPTVDANGTLIDLSNASLAVRTERKIDLAAGERPTILGEESIWWIMNDRGNEHQSAHTMPLGVEVHGTAFAASSWHASINQSTLYSYRIINRNTVPIENAYFAVFLDVELGYGGDDYVGSDSLRGIGFVYNADNFDEAGEGYGENPPALGVQILRGPLADDDGFDNDHDGNIDETGEQAGMSSFMTFSGGICFYCEPIIGQDFYNYMRGRWKNGERITFGGHHGNEPAMTGTPTNYFYPGDPVTGAFWSERNFDGQGTEAMPYDRRFIVSTGPFDLAPGEATDIVFAIVFGQGSDHLDSATIMKRAADAIRIVFEANQLTAFAASPRPGDSEPSYEAAIGNNYPDPFSDRTTIKYTVPHKAFVRLAVYDVLGRMVATLVQEPKEAGEYEAIFDGLNHPSGIYFYQIEIDHASEVLSMVLSK